MDNLRARILESALSDSERADALLQQEQQFPRGLPECGADALRFGLCAYTQQARNINLDVNRIISCKQFGHKLWNAFLYALPKLKGACPPYEFEPPQHVWNRWILSRLAATVQQVDHCFQAYDLPGVTAAIQRFWLIDFCDVYLEQTKPMLRNGPDDLQAETRRILFKAMDTALRLLCPVMPFLTEELWQRLYYVSGLEQPCKSLTVAAFPLSEHWDAFLCPSLEEELAEIQACFKTARRAVQLLQVPQALIYIAPPKTAAALETMMAVSRLQICLLSEHETPPSGSLRLPYAGDWFLFLALSQDMDTALLQREVDRLAKHLVSLTLIYRYTYLLMKSRR